MSLDERDPTLPDLRHIRLTGFHRCPVADRQVQARGVTARAAHSHGSAGEEVRAGA